MPRNNKIYSARLTFYKMYILYLFRGICSKSKFVPVEKNKHQILWSGYENLSLNCSFYNTFSLANGLDLD